MIDKKLEPYLNRITIGDSLVLLNKLPMNTVDLVLTDPPYDFDEPLKTAYHMRFLEAARMWAADGQIIVFCPPENPWIGKPTQILFWIKSISTKNTSKRYSRFVEMIYVYEWGKWNHNRHWSQYTNIFTDLVDDTKLHPFRKPPSLIERLILNHSDEGDVILDPFAGSGVIFDVCQRLNRNYIGFEIDGQYERN